ncbi:hypothetical protein FA15DRAFT_693701 [Coprinopsis marcescibilis]|uniref:WD40 repeat-like protein n=1 Tax=Coprinopsis marcescibilis TaxID=230819 RepID=A0A5C3KZK4_COPMA|nr:hypothetical protein FA15DRAFT_693701 [Coprinopsis marcescibilis]
MPKDLPGLYWDHEKNRYFPLSARPASSSRQTPAKTTGGSSPGTTGDGLHVQPKQEAASRPSLKRKGGVNSPVNHVHMGSQSWNWVGNNKIRRRLTAGNISQTTKHTRWDVPTSGRTTTFCTYPCSPDDSYSENRLHILGDSLGWIYRCDVSEGIDQERYSDDENQSTNPHCSSIRRSSWLPWSIELNLQPSGSISSMSTSASCWVATGSGNSPRVVFSDIRHLDRMCIITLSKVRELWTSHLYGKELTLGSNSKAIYLPDVDQSPSPQFLSTDSDVFSVVQDEHLIYTGSRNGAIHRFDKRIGFKGRGQVLFGSRFNKSGSQNNSRSPVLRLELMAQSPRRTLESGLLVSHMDGNLQLFDLRRASSSVSAKAEPAVQYFGHINSYRKDLGLAIDHEADLLYASGQDCRIRGWQLSTGEALRPPLPSPTPSTSSPGYQTRSIQNFSNPFLATFEDPIEVLRVSPMTHSGQRRSDVDDSIETAGEDQERVGSVPEGACLWAANGRDLWRWNLGQRGLR